MTSASKAKGNRLEYQIADTLSAWWGSSFKRMPASGALRWKGAAFTYGDLLPPDDFNAIVECKNHKYPDLDELLRKDFKQSYIGWWWTQVWEDSIRCQRETGIWPHPLLVYNQPHHRPRLVMRSQLIHNLPKALEWNVLHFSKEQISIMLLDDFIAGVTKAEFQEVTK